MEGNARTRAMPTKRISKQLEEKTTVLIICEGQKTEPNYFNKLKEKYHLSNIIILKNTKPSPSSVVRVAMEKQREYKLDAKNSIIYCVFDRDEHKDIDNALDMIKAKSFNAILSSVCFEIWYLLHFEYITHIFSSFDEIKNRLVKIPSINNYDKEPGDYTEFLNDKNINSAISNAKKLQEYCKNVLEYGTKIEFLRKICKQNLTFTNVNLIVEKMQELSKKS
ncbi:RloB family protein [Campylobacter sp. CLAX-7218-21]|uniref:RloB family protein n=1 Tax=Campylobacter devanensis TaxID=3161138 RepID=UPI002EC7C5CA|nr:RloB family protein [Campylobacter sp. CLAX-7218-21]